MLNRTHYVPILKSKDGEFGALKELSAMAKSRLVPLVEVIPARWDFNKNKPTKSMNDQLKYVCNKLSTSWGVNHRFFLDLYWIPEAERTADGQHPVTFVFDDVRAKNLLPIPVTGLRSDGDYQTAVRDVIQTDSRGVCIRIKNEDLGEPSRLSDDLYTLLQ